MRPMNGKVIVHKSEDKKEHVSDGGIYMGTTNNEGDKTPATGKVLEVSPEAEALGLSVGDEIVFGKYVGIPVQVSPGMTVLILDKSEVLMIL